MSSILDALKKLEQERGVRDESSVISMDVEMAREDLLRGARGGDGVTIRLTPKTIVIGGVLGGILFVAVSVGVSFTVARSAAPPGPARAQAETAATAFPVPAQPLAGTPPGATEPLPEPDPEATARPAAPSLPPAPEPATPVPGGPPKEQLPARAPEEGQVLPREAPAPGKLEHPGTSNAGNDAVRREDPLPVVQPKAPAPSPVQPVPVQAPSTDKELDLDSLPILTPGEQIRLGLPEIVVNIAGSSRGNRVSSKALINKQRVFVNDFIPDTGNRVRLIGVSVYGIAVEIDGRARYFLEK